MQKTSIIISCSSMDVEYTKALVDSLRRYTLRGSYQLIIVEHGNSTSARNWLIEQVDILTLFHEETLTQAQAWNIGFNAATGDNVLFLHSDVLVTENWLSYMVQSLYQDEDIAGVGPVTNFAEGEQQIPVQFMSIEELLSFARENSRRIQQSQKLTLSDFCMLFKREVVEQIGPFQEQLSGMALGIDYSLRIIQSGHKLLLNKHVFLYHYGEKDNDLISNSREFRKIWRFEIIDTQECINLLPFLPDSYESPLRILHIGSGCGATLLSLKHSYPQAELFGVECNKKAASINIEFDKSTKSTIEEHQFEEDTFDYILISTVKDPMETLSVCANLLHAGGQIILDFPNDNHFSTIQRMLKNEPVLSRGTSGFNLHEMSRIFEEAGFDELHIDYLKKEMTSSDLQFTRGLRSLVDHELPEHFDVTNFIIRATKNVNPETLHEKFNRLFQAPSDEMLNQILLHSTQTILSAVDSYSGPSLLLLNYLAISNYERNQMDQVLPFLNKAYDMESKDPTTLLNLGTVSYGLGREEDALHWFKKLPEKNEQIEKWVYELEEVVSLKTNPKKWLKFLILRVEHNVQREDSLKEIVEFINKDQKTRFSFIEEIIIHDIIDKLTTITLLINAFYENQDLGEVIALLGLSEKHGADPNEVSKLTKAIRLNYRTL
ncbi:glycosyltransferase [Paenibacillus sp. FSL R7-0216]|uniref:glycosyltransferase n=1 Tax=Paenibacillus sp. FSL R7-0216 TaxID=2921677 RepID=UPI0030DA9FCB